MVNSLKRSYTSLLWEEHAILQLLFVHPCNANDENTLFVFDNIEHNTSYQGKLSQSSLSMLLLSILPQQQLFDKSFFFNKKRRPWEENNTTAEMEVVQKIKRCQWRVHSQNFSDSFSSVILYLILSAQKDEQEKR